MSGRVVRAFAAALVLLWLTVGIAHGQDAQPGDDFLKALDTQHYAESWDMASDYLKQSVSRDEWTSQMVRTRDTIGSVASRTLQTSEPLKDFPGAPPGEYLLLTYRTVFASQGAAKTETLPLIKGADGRWRAVGYFVR